jgi:hypothetical protein
VLIARQLSTYGRFDLQLLTEFAYQGLLRRLPNLYLPAGELPFEGMAIRWPALADQDLTVPVDDAG